MSRFKLVMRSINKPRRFAFATAVATLICSTGAFAEWRIDFGGTTALSNDESVVFSCSPEDSAVSNLTLEIFVDTPVPTLETPTLSFEFDIGETFDWQDNYGGELYIGPMLGIGDSSNKVLGYMARISFGSHRAATGNWVHLAEQFMRNRSVTVALNGVKHGPISLRGSSKALHNIAYLKSPCK